MSDDDIKTILIVFKSVPIGVIHCLKIYLNPVLISLY